MIIWVLLKFKSFKRASLCSSIKLFDKIKKYSGGLIMFGIKTKIYNIVALVFACLGVITLTLKVFNVLPLESWTGVIDGNTMTLISLVLFMIGIVIYFRPKMKKLKIMQNLTSRYRNDLYAELTKGNKLQEEPKFYQNEQDLLQIGSFVYDGLPFSDAIKVNDSLMKDYAMIVYGILDEKKKKIVASKKEYFAYTIEDKDHKEVIRKLIEDYKFNK